jgi:hypothetical protein
MALDVEFVAPDIAKVAVSIVPSGITFEFKPLAKHV